MTLESRTFLIEEGQAGDECVVTIESGDHRVLPVVTKQFRRGEHGQAAVLKLLGHTLFQNIGAQFWLAL